MDILQYMNQISALMERKQDRVTGPQQLFVLDRQFHIGPVDLTAHRDRIIIHLTKNDFDNGLKGWQWESIFVKIKGLMREGEL